MAVKVIEICQVTPSEGAPQEQILPLLNFDIVRLPYHLLNILYFYKLPCSQLHFLNTVVPRLNTSFSVALKHFLPLAANLVFPLTPSAMPVSHYKAGDSVPVTVAISDADFSHVTANHPRDADQFRAFLPLTLPHEFSDDGEDVPAIRFSPLAIQVTLLPNQGICIGKTINHAICDGGTIFSFVKVWGSVSKFDGDAHVTTSRLYDRSGVANKYLATRAWNYASKYSPAISLTIALPTNKVRATFFLTDSENQTLKNIFLNKKPGKATIASSMVILSGYVWSCLAKSAAIAGEDVSDDEAEYLTCTADVRGLMNPPLPLTYFGNCTVLVLAESTHGTLKGQEGFVSAAHAIGEAIRNNRKRNVFDDLEHRIKVKGGNKRVVTMAGSPRYDSYVVDFGWGKPEKFDYLTTDCDESVFLCKPREGGGTEIIMSMNKAKMDAFAAFFHQGLKEATESSYMNIIPSNL